MPISNGLSLKRSQTVHVPCAFHSSPFCPVPSDTGERRAKPFQPFVSLFFVQRMRESKRQEGCWCDGKATLIGRETGTPLPLWPKHNVIHVVCARPLAAQPLQLLSWTRGEQERSCLLRVFWIKAEGKLGRKELPPCKLGSSNALGDSQHVGATGSSQCLGVLGRRPSGQRQALSTE